MDPAVCQRVGFTSKTHAISYANSGNHGRAFAHFLVALKLNPGWKIGLKEIFNCTLKKWGAKLELKKRYDDLFNCYEQAIEVFPENEIIYAELGHILLRLNSPKDAVNYFRKYLNINPWDIEVIRSLENTCNLVIERWHFRMLNDEHRNEAFREAIVKKISAGYHTVLDIGTGSGILSLFAAEGGAESIFACESSSAMAAIATHVFEHHEVSNIRFWNKHSTSLTLPEKVHLIVCEILDCCLLGEHVLETLVDAHRRFLRPNGGIIPASSKLHLSGIQAPFISGLWHLKNLPPPFEMDKYTFSVSGWNDEYDTENLELIPNGYKIITDVASAVTIDFNNPIELQDFLDGNRDCIVVLKATERGVIDCICGWFTLRLDEDILIETKPGSPAKCWDQAIFPTPYPLNVELHNEIPLKLSFKFGKIVVDFMPENSKLIKVSQSIVKMLNDSKFLETLFIVAESLADARNSSCQIIDTSPFPYFGLIFLKLRPCYADQLRYSSTNLNDINFIKLIAAHLHVEDKIIYSDEEYSLNFKHGHNKYDIILLSTVEETGELSELYLSNIANCRNALNSEGIILPEQLIIKGQLVESSWLLGVSRVLNNEVTCGYSIAPSLNLFKVNHHIDFRLGTLPMIKRSSPNDIMKIKLSEADEEITTLTDMVVSERGPVTGIVYWFQLNFIQGKTESSFSTLESSSFFNQSAFLFDTVTDGFFKIETKYANGIFRSRWIPK